MKTVKLFILAITCIAALSACGRDNPDPAKGGKPISIQAGIGDLTKVQTTGYTAIFESGDQVSLYAWTGSATTVPAEKVVNGVKNTLGTDGKWTPETQMLWADMVTPHYFLGICPARTVTDFTADPFTLDPANYAASDLLVATNVMGLKAQDNPVAMGFHHAMAMLNVNLSFRNQWGTEPTVTAVSATAKKSATIDYLTGLVTAGGTAEAVALTSKANNAWSGLQVPQTGVTTITISVDGKDYVFTHTSDIPLVGGKYTTINLTVGRDKIELAAPVTITAWTSQGAAIEGDAEEKEQDEEKPKINGHEYVDLGLSVKWATCNVGATESEGLGDYFAWGEKEPYYSSQSPLTWKNGKEGYSWDSYFDAIDGNTFTKYAVDKKTVLEAEDDAAAANWGGTWRMPTEAEWQQLLALDKQWVENYNGSSVNGYTFTGNGNTIFIPAAGYRTSFDLLGKSFGDYWSSSLYVDVNNSNNDSACGVFLSSSLVLSKGYMRFEGRSIRPVTQ